MIRRHAAKIASGWGSVAAFLGGCMFVVSCLLIMGVTHDSRWGAATYPLLLLLLFAVVVIHEAGHLLGAIYAGETVLGLSAGPVLIERRRCGLRLAWRSINPATAGYLVSIPDFGCDIRRQMLITVAAGPVANILLGLTVLFGIGVSRHMSWDTARVWLAVFAAYNIVIGLINAVPAGTLGHNDGSMFLDWLRGNDRAQKAADVMRLYAHSLQGGTPSELQLDTFPSQVATQDISTQLWWMFPRVARAQELGETGELRALMEQCRLLLKQLDATAYASIRLMWAYFLFEETYSNVLSGDALGETIDPVLLKRMPRDCRFRYESVVCLNKRDLDGARESLAKAQREVDGNFAEGGRRYEGVLLGRLRAEIDRIAASGHPIELRFDSA